MGGERWWEKEGGTRGGLGPTLLWMKQAPLTRSKLGGSGRAQRCGIATCSMPELPTMFPGSCGLVDGKHRGGADLPPSPSQSWGRQEGPFGIAKDANESTHHHPGRWRWRGRQGY